MKRARKVSKNEVTQFVIKNRFDGNLQFNSFLWIFFYFKVKYEWHFGFKIVINYQVFEL